MPTSFLMVVCLTYAKQPPEMEMPHCKQSVPRLFSPILVFSPRSNINLPFFPHLKPMISRFTPGDHRENVTVSLPTETWEFRGC